MKIIQLKPIFLFMVACVFFTLNPCANCFGSMPEKEITAIEREEKVKVDASLSELSQEEQDWYHKFQNGVLLFDGWKQISQYIIADFPDKDDQIQLKESLKDLGKKIGIEWSKDNAIRKIDSDMLRQWGEVLNKAVDQGIAHIIDTINRIEKEVDEILISKFSSDQKI